jgi:hypothetical protein
MRPIETRIFEAGPTLIDPDDDAQVCACAENLHAAPEDVREAVETVGPNIKAVELYLALPLA